MPTSGLQPRPLFTIGHSTHQMPELIGLLTKHGIAAVADVRSHPYSQYSPQFNRELLERALKPHGILYAFLGQELGARRTEPECYVNHKARYDLVAKLPLFQKGLERIRQAAATQRLALLCAEKDPITCHRMVLVCRSLRQSGLAIQHILEDGSLQTNQQAEERLLELFGLPPGDLFRSQAELIEQAYNQQGEKIAFVEASEAAHASLPVKP